MAKSKSKASGSKVKENPKLSALLLGAAISRRVVMAALAEMDGRWAEPAEQAEAEKLKARLRARQ